MPSTDLVYRFLGIDAGAGAQFDRMATRTAALGKSSDVALKAVKSLGVAAGVAAVVIGVESVKAAANFQTALTRIHTQANASTKTVATLRKGILDMTSTVATSPTELAKAAYHIASVGQNSLTSAQQLQILRVAAEEAKISGANLEDVTNSLAVAVISGIKGVHDYGQAMGVLNATVGAGNMTMQDLAESLGTGVLASAKNAGLSIRDVAGALAVLGDNKRVASIAGNTLTRTFNLMLAPSKAAADALKTIGLTQTSLATDMRKPNGLVTALADLKAHLKSSGLTAVQQAQVISEAFGRSRGSTYVELLLQQLNRLQTKEAEVAAGGKNFASSWKGYTKTFGYAWDSMRNAVQRLLIEIGTRLMPVATRFVKWVGSDLIPWLERAGHEIGNQFAGSIKSMGSSLRGIEASLAALGPAVGPTLRLIAVNVQGSLTMLNVSLRASREMLGGLAIAAVAAFRVMVDSALAFIGTFVHAGAAAFGWVPFVGPHLRSAAAAFDEFRSHVDNTLSAISADAYNAMFAAGQNAVAGFNFGIHAAPAGGSGNLNPAVAAGGMPKKKHTTFTIPPLNLPNIGGGGGGGAAPAGGGGGGGGTAAAANTLHITAQHLVRALAKGLLDGWQGFSLTVEQSLSSGTQHLLNALAKQFQAVQDKMKKLVQNARTTLHNAVQAERQYVAQMMNDAALTNVPTVASGYLANGGQKLSSIGVFLHGQAGAYASFAAALRRLAHRGLSKALLNQIAEMGPTQGLQYAQQILSGGAGSIASLNASERQIQRSAHAIGQDRYGAEIRADRKHLARMVVEQRRTNHHLEHLAHQIGVEMRRELAPYLGKGLHNQQGLTPHQAQQLERDLRRLNRQLGK